MKNIIDFFRNRKNELAIFIALSITSILSGVNFGLLIILALFYWSVSIIASNGYKTVSLLLKGVVVLALIVSLVGAWFPRSSQKWEYTKAFVDQQWSSVLPDKTQVEAVDSWDMSKDQQREEFLNEYRQALRRGDTKLAYELLEKFQSKWDMEEVANSLQAMKDSIAAERLARIEFVRDSIAKAKQDSLKGSELVITLPPGKYNFALKAGEKSKKIIINGSGYCAISNNNQFRLYYPELQKAVPAWTSGTWPLKYVFYIESMEDQLVTITVT